MARIIAVANQKGGVAKTATCIQLAAGLKRKGYRVLMVDTDSQRNTTNVYKAATDGVATIHDLLFTRNIDPYECIQKTELGDIIASDKLMENDNANLTGMRESLILKKALANFDKDYDFIIIDHNPGQGGTIANALTAANDVIIPMLPEGFSIDGAVDMSERIESVREFTNHNLRVAGILITFYNYRAVLTRQFMEQEDALTQLFNTKIFKTKIRTSQSVKDACTYGVSVFDYKNGNNNGAEDYGKFVEEYLDDLKEIS